MLAFHDLYLDVSIPKVGEQFIDYIFDNYNDIDNLYSKIINRETLNNKTIKVVLSKDDSAKATKQELISLAIEKMKENLNK